MLKDRAKEDKPMVQWVMSEFVNVEDPTGEFPGGINKLAIIELGTAPDTEIIYNAPHDEEGNTILGPVICRVATKNMKPFKDHPNCDLLPEVTLDTACNAIPFELKTKLLNEVEARHGASVKTTVNSKMGQTKAFRDTINYLGKLTDPEFDVDDFEARGTRA